MQSVTAKVPCPCWTRVAGLASRQQQTLPTAYTWSVSGVVCQASSQPQESGQANEAPAPSAAGAGPETEPQVSHESIVFQNNGSKAEVAVSVLLGFSLLYLPLTLASVARYIWSKYTFTDKRMIIEFSSPIRKETTQITYDKLREVRSVNRGFGLWGDMVFFLKDGSRLEIVGIEDPLAIKAFVEGQMTV